MTEKEELPRDPLIDYADDGVPIAKTSEDEIRANSNDPKQIEEDAQKTGLAGHEYEKKRQGTEDAQKRSDTGTGI